MSENIEECTCSSVGEMFFDDEDSPDFCMKCGGVVVGVKNIEPVRTELMFREEKK